MCSTCCGDKKIQELHDFTETRRFRYVKQDFWDSRFGYISLMVNEVANGLLFTKKKLLNDADDMESYHNVLANRQNNIRHNNILKMTDHGAHKSKIGEPDGYFITAIYEWPRTDLEEVILEYNLGNTNYYIPPEVLMNIAIDCTEGLTFLESRNLAFHDLRPKYIGKKNNDNNWLLMDRLADPKKHPACHQDNIKNKVDPYMAPEALEELCDVRTNRSPNRNGSHHNQNLSHSIKSSKFCCKSDVFSLGMCLLSAGTKESTASCYDLVHLHLNQQNLNNLMQKFRQTYQNYNKVLVDFVEKCLTLQYDMRPSPSQLSSFLKKSNARVIDPMSVRCGDNKFVIITHCKHEE